MPSFGDFVRSTIIHLQSLGAFCVSAMGFFRFQVLGFSPRSCAPSDNSPHSCISRRGGGGTPRSPYTPDGVPIAGARHQSLAMRDAPIRHEEISGEGRGDVSMTYLVPRPGESQRRLGEEPDRRTGAELYTVLVWEVRPSSESCPSFFQSRCSPTSSTPHEWVLSELFANRMRLR